MGALGPTISPTRRARQMLFGFATPQSVGCSSVEKEVTCWPSPSKNLSPGMRPSAPRNGRRQSSALAEEKSADKEREGWQVVWSDWQVDDVDVNPIEDAMAWEQLENCQRRHGIGPRPGSCVPGPRSAAACGGGLESPEFCLDSPSRGSLFHRPMDASPTSKRIRGRNLETFAIQMDDSYEAPKRGNRSQLSPFP